MICFLELFALNPLSCILLLSFYIVLCRTSNIARLTYECRGGSARPDGCIECVCCFSAVFTLDLFFCILANSFYHYFLCPKSNQKGSARGRTICSLLLFVNCPSGQYHSSVVRSPFQAFLLVAGLYTVLLTVPLFFNITFRNEHSRVQW